MNIIIIPVFSFDPNHSRLGITPSKDDVKSHDAMIFLQNIVAITKTYSGRNTLIHTVNGIFESPLNIDEVQTLLIGDQTNETNNTDYEWNRLRQT